MIIVVLLCQLVTTTFVHAPMAYAATLKSEMSPTAEGYPCPDHQAAKQPGAAVHASHTGEHHGTSEHAEGCKSGLCNCSCAHTPALAATVALGIPEAPAHDSPIAYSGHSVPGCTKTLFRPPI
jgi:hypothetical protein